MLSCERHLFGAGVQPTRWSLSRLETRLLLAGDAGVAVAETGGPDAVAPLVSTTDPSSAARSALANQIAMSSEIAVVDADVDAGEELAALMRRGVDVVLIDGSSDPLTQIGEVLSVRQDVRALHVISHGDAGQLRLGGETIDANRLVAESSTLASWRSSLAPNADILLYGCDVAAGDIGGRFIETLSRLTGADVAASTNRTGFARSSGDWVLESETGRIEADLFASLIDLSEVQVVLPITFDDQASLPDYADFSSVAGLNLNGDAQQSGNDLELTFSTQQSGSAFYDQSISLENDASFQSSFSFQILGGTTGADGLAFVIQNDTSGANAIGGTGSNLGYVGIDNSLAVEFDTFKWWSAESNDNHVAINVGSFTNDLAVADPGFDLNDGNQRYAWVDYDGVSDTLSVYVSETATKPGQALLETTVDLPSLAWHGGLFRIHIRNRRIEQRSSDTQLAVRWPSVTGSGCRRTRPIGRRGDGG